MSHTFKAGVPGVTATRLASFDPGPSLTGWSVIVAQGGVYTYLAGGYTESERVWADFLAKCRPDLVVVETVTYQGPRRSGKYVLETARIGGLIAGAAGPIAVEIPAPSWRLQLLGRSNPSDKDVRAWVTANVVNFPEKLHYKQAAHVTDSVAVACAAAREREL